MTPQILTIVLAVVGVAFACFYGAKACSIFEVDTSKKPMSWRIHQFWFNFLGCLSGWAALWMLLDRHGWFLTGQPGEIGLSDGVLLATAFIGMTGHLPMSMMGVLGTLGEAATKLIGLASKEKH